MSVSAGDEILITVLPKIKVLRGITPCLLVNCYRYFEAIMLSDMSTIIYYSTQRNFQEDLNVFLIKLGFYIRF
jgi:hypothetical protein